MQNCDYIYILGLTCTLLPFSPLQYSFHICPLPFSSPLTGSPKITQTNTARYDEDFPQAKAEWSKDKKPITNTRIATDSDETRLTLPNNGHGVSGAYKETSNHVEIDAVQCTVEAECKLCRIDLPSYSLTTINNLKIEACEILSCAHLL